MDNADPRRAEARRLIDDPNCVMLITEIALPDRRNDLMLMLEPKQVKCSTEM
jgi:hypothetical protein